AVKRTESYFRIGSIYGNVYEFAGKFAGLYRFFLIPGIGITPREVFLPCFFKFFWLEFIWPSCSHSVIPFTVKAQPPNLRGPHLTLTFASQIDRKSTRLNSS